MAKDQVKELSGDKKYPALDEMGKPINLDRMAVARAARGRYRGPVKSNQAKSAVQMLRQIRSLGKMLLDKIELSGELPDGVNLSILADAQAVIARAVV